MFSVAVLASVLSVVSAYSKCSPGDVKGPITIPITKVLGPTHPIQISGSIEIIDGCNFKVTGFSLTNANSARWYGANGTAFAGATLSETSVTSSTPAEQTFVFRSVAGAEVSFRDFDQFRLMQDDQLVIATANVPPEIGASLGKTPATNTTATNTTNTTSTTTAVKALPTGNTTTTSRSAVPVQPSPSNSAQKIGEGMLGLVLMALF
jgi:hypothetical protein